MNNIKSKTNLSAIIDYSFTILIFALAFISYPFILNENKVGKELFLVFIVSLWLFFKVLSIFKEKTFRLYTCDFVMALFVLYIIVHYTLFSFFSFGYNYFWVLICCIILFYLFRTSLETQNKSDALFRFTIKLIWFYCFIESVVALLQKMKLLEGHNEYFDVVGTFVNPNFLGVYMDVGLVVTFYMLLFFELKKSVIVLFLTGGLSMFFVLFLTDSRASWISLAMGLLFLVLSSPKNISFFKVNKKKGLTILASLILLVFVSLFFLYYLNKDSVDGRTLIRKITISEIKENPVFGNGIFNFTSIYNTSKAHYFNDSNRPWEEIKVANYVSTSFNDYLQIIFELGFTGFIILILLFYTIVRTVKLNPKTRLGLSLLVVFAILGLFTSVLYNPTAMILAVWVLSLLFAGTKDRMEALTIMNIFYIRCILLFCISFSLILLVFFYFKTQALIDFKSVVEENNQKLYYKFSDKRMLLIEDEPYVEFRFGFEKYHEGEAEKGLLMMTNSIKKAPIPDANLTLANLYLSNHRILRAEELLQLNVGIEPFRFEPRENLLRFYLDTKQEDELLRTANSIIDLPVKIKSNEILNYKKRAQHIVKEYSNTKL